MFLRFFNFLYPFKVRLVVRVSNFLLKYLENLYNQLMLDNLLLFHLQKYLHNDVYFE